MQLIVAIVVGLLLGWYFHKRQKPMTVKDWFFGLFIILIFVIITDAILHIDVIKQGFQDGVNESLEEK